ncbi:MAG: DUF2867 domain-containing protein [Burkholderiales bacterium]|nr:DUF2867 domain-containing protein [Anaerolineae bacterium]
MNYVQTLPSFASVLRDADHVDVKTVEGGATLREFIASMLAYQPAWVTFLYRVRSGFVRLLGMRQEGIPSAPHFQPETVPMMPGEKAAFFTVQLAEEEKLWLVGVDDSHLSAMLGVAVEPLSGDQKRFHVVTVVYYHNWAGPLYFNVIRPFHHLVVSSMARAGVRA